ncbi:nitrogen regulation protein NR(II) [Candidatus Uabimicrobium sp. HlEnr_7]|uniref:two-component system sensor histidine kinase NtrB n=1 Tax=Candidatus Uabimicrobium helgolandensis TaxID=3095367 RepID=UPI003558E409
MAEKKIKSKKHKQEYDVIKLFAESVNQSIVVTDTKEKIVIWNSQIESQFSGKEQAIGQPLKKMFPRFREEFRGKILADIISKDVIKKGKTHEFSRYPLEIKSQKIRYFDLQFSPFKNNNGEIIGCIMTMIDATDKIYMENQLLRNARTTSLANLGASIAHEIRNPLNSISLNIQLIKEDIESSNSQTETLEIIDNVLYEIQRLNKIIKNFLSFSRPPEPRFILSDINDIIRRVLSLLREDARQAGVEIVSNLERLSLTLVDPDQISQAVYNIALNAIQEMNNTSGILEVSTLSVDEYILIEIKDNGPSLQMEDKSQLFDLFFTTKEDGTGLGLPIANRIIERHEGRIVAENNLDQGACFGIYIPVIKE